MARVLIEGVSKSFHLPTGERRQAVREVNLELPDGGFVTVVGPSGCGKTTLMRMVAGLTRPSTGRILFTGHSGEKLRIGMVFQDATLMPWINVIDNVTMPARIGRSKGMRSARERGLALLRSVGLAGSEELFPWQLSGGMRQRVAIARALMDDPQVLLMDEPFGALDAMTRDQMVVDLEQIWMETNKTVMFVTHSTREAAFLSDRVVVMTGSPGGIASILNIDHLRPRGNEGLTSAAVAETEAVIRAALAAPGAETGPVAQSAQG